MTTETPDSPATETPTDARPVHVALCQHEGCKAGVKYRLTTSGHGLMVIERYGVEPDVTIGLSDHARPRCPFGHGEMTLADEHADPLPPAHLAIAAASDALTGAEQQRLPGIVHAFNYAGCYQELEEKAVEVERLRAIYDDDAKEARESKKTWEKAADLYVKMALEFRRRRREKQDGTEPPRLVDAATLSTAEVLAGDLADVADLIIESTIVETWSDDDRRAVQAWLDGGSTTAVERDAWWAHRPTVLGTAHIAADVSLDEEAQVQACTECGTVLLQLTEDVEPHVGGQFVGVDCPGAVEPHRYPAKSNKKTRGKKTETPADPAAAAQDEKYDF